MSKRKAQRASRRKARTPPAARTTATGDGESRASVAVTVGWMLCLLATLLSVAGFLLAALLVRALRDQAEAQAESLAVLPPLMLFTSLVTGTLCLLMTLAAWRIRVRKAPLAITVSAIVTGLVPWLLWAALPR